MTETQIQEALEEIEPGSRLLSTKPLTGGISATTLRLEVALPNGETKKFVARHPPPWKFQLNPQQASKEYQVLKAARAAGIQAPRPRYLSDNEPHPFLILDFMEGDVDLRPTNVQSYVEHYARQLVQIHRTDLSDFAFLGEHAESYWEGPKPWNDTMRETEIREVLKLNPPVKPNRKVLRHADFWPGNVLWRDGEIVGVLDWEETVIGEPLADLSICRLDLWWVFGPEAADEFTLLYQAEMNLDLTDLPHWDLRNSLRPVANLGEWAASYPDLGRPDVTEESMRRDHGAFVDRALCSLGV